MPPMSTARIESPLMPRACLRRPPPRSQPLGDVLGAGDRRADDHGERSRLDGRLRLIRRANAASAITGLPQPAMARTSARSGASGIGPPCSRKGSCRRSPLRDVLPSRPPRRRYVGHGDAAMPDEWRRGGRRRERDEDRPSHQSDDVRPGRCEGIDVVHGGADPDGRPREVALDEAYDRRGGGGADGRHVRDPSMRTTTAPLASAASASDDDFRPVERAAHHRLAGYDQRSAKFVGEAQAHALVIADDIRGRTS